MLSTTVEALMALGTDYLAFDIDWLAESASDLAGKSIYFEPTTWQPYGVLWNEVLYAIYRNGRTPILIVWPTFSARIACESLSSPC